MDYGSPVGLESSSPSAPSGAAGGDDEPRPSRPRRTGALTGPSWPAAPAGPAIPLGAKYEDGLAQQQQAGITAIIGLAETTLPARPAPAAAVATHSRATTGSALAPETSLPGQAAATSATERPLPAEPAAAVLVRPTAQKRPREAAFARQATSRLSPDDVQQDRFRHLPGLCLMVVILSVQAALSALFLRANTAFGDEALYLWAGHLEWSHWLHGTRIPAFPTWFSGSPAIYPPIGAIADSLGGLQAARALSLCFMLGATCLLWGATARLFGRPAAYYAAALFAVLGPTLHLGAFATYDAMALFLMSLAAWCACAARTRQDATGWMMACAGALALANATKYASALFDPVVIGVAVLAACPNPGGKAALRRGALLVTSLAGALAVLLRIGGPWYILGISQTTTQRPAGQDPLSKVFSESWQWTAVVVGTALVALVLSLIKRNSGPVTWLIGVLAAAALLVPAEQARIQTTVSLDKHVDFGAWFACIAGGYALATLAAWPRPKPARTIVAACLGMAILPVGAIGLTQATKMVYWPGSSQLVKFLRPLTSRGGHFLAETDDVPEFYLPATSWRQWSNTFSITKPDGRSVFVHGSMGPYAQAIRQHYFSLVIMNFAETPAVDAQLTTVLSSTPGYELIRYIPYSGPESGNYAIWEYRPAFASQPAVAADRHPARAAPPARAGRP